MNPLITAIDADQYKDNVVLRVRGTDRETGTHFQYSEKWPEDHAAPTAAAAVVDEPGIARRMEYKEKAASVGSVLLPGTEGYDPNLVMVQGDDGEGLGSSWSAYKASYSELKSGIASAMDGELDEFLASYKELLDGFSG